ncbi:short chain dehydrogenase [Bacillus sp. FJAT-27225]|uniref:short chain dehydrogenase n=1 Tax=Bacillus sp. FJAT-27225 TaxID=1743144 RepID=UPI00080C338A|nr:short chain dehydrogenase [Bacillus sp. FJAT-27225]OCA88002.1 short chain dehydrogenase [Bacillus sp. FJAT-27225]
MRILQIGASGTIGKAVAEHLGNRHEIISASRTGGEVYVDLTSPQSIKDMYAEVGNVDAVVCTAGETYFGKIDELTPENNDISIQNKLKGQMNVVLLGIDYVNDRGSFTLTTGIIMDDPIIGGISSAMVSGGLKSFVRAAAIEMPRGIRINTVSPGIIAESIKKYGPYFPGFEPVPASRVALAYQKSVEGGQTGRTYTVY